MTIEQLKEIAEARIESAKILMDGSDWFWASISMATALECALKAMICKTLNLSVYPEDPKQQTVLKFFRTHEFERLLILSGLNYVFSPSQGEPNAVQSWSGFTKEFPGEWSETKYDLNRQMQFDETKTKLLYKNLLDDERGILMIIKKKW